VIAALALVLAVLIISLLAAAVLALLTRNAELERQLEQAELYAAECAFEAKMARIEYTKILWLHTGDMVPLMSQAWRAALNK